MMHICTTYAHDDDSRTWIRRQRRHSDVLRTSTSFHTAFVLFCFVLYRREQQGCRLIMHHPALWSISMVCIEGRRLKEWTTQLFSDLLHFPDAEIWLVMMNALIVIFKIILAKVLSTNKTRGTHTFHPSHFESCALSVLISEKHFAPAVDAGVKSCFDHHLFVWGKKL